MTEKLQKILIQDFSEGETSCKNCKTYQESARCSWCASRRTSSRNHQGLIFYYEITESGHSRKTTPFCFAKLKFKKYQILYLILKSIIL